MANFFKEITMKEVKVLTNQPFLPKIPISGGGGGYKSKTLLPAYLVTEVAR